MDYVWSALIGYLLGSISSGLLLVKWVCGIDIRDYGSHNIGATNVFRTVGGPAVTNTAWLRLYCWATC